tara:strand:- start:96675 stop:99380 length:2706 start_codon:yes stop_codon:yes gene_type:complete
MKPASRIALLTICSTLLLTTPVSPAVAQPTVELEHDHQPPTADRLGVPEELGQITQALKDQLAADFLTDEERAQLRVKHGLWTPTDLENPIFMARAALAVGAYDHPSLSNPDADPFDRATAALKTGQPQRVLELIAKDLGEISIPELNLHAQALEMLGHHNAAITTLETIETKLAETTITNADDIAFAVEGLMQLTRLRGPQQSAREEYQNLAKLLANARDNLDRLSWRVRLVEAKLLYAHNNYKDAHAAAVETLRLHPRNAQAASLIGNMAVDSFNFDTADEIATKIDLIAAGTINSQSEKLPPTLHSAIINARVALRRKDPLGAEYAIDQILVTMPDQRDLLELNAAAAAAGFRMRSVQHLLNQYDERSPNSPFALMRVANTLSEYRQYTYAAEMFRRIIERAPYWAQPRLDLGLLLVQAGKDEHAKSELESALDLDPFDLRAQNSLTLVTELASYETIETDHFIIRYKSDSTDEILANEMPEILERIHARVSSNQPGGVDHEPSTKTKIELMPNHEWFAVRIGGMPSIHTMAASTGPVIAIEAPHEGQKSSVGHYDWQRVLQHEYTHTVNLSRTKNRVIHWMTEANAVYNEDAPRSSQTWSLLTNAYENNELFDLDEINTAFVRPKKPSDRSLAYAQGAWMFEYIIEHYGPNAPLDIYDASAAGRSASDAFAQVLSTNPQSFLEEFRSWAHDQLIARGLILPDDTPDLNELFDTDDNTKPQIPTIAQIDALLEQYPDHPQLITLKIGVALVGADTRLTESQVAILQHAITVRPTDESPHQRLAKHYLAGDSFDQRKRAIPYLEYLDIREIHSPAFAGELALLYAQSAQPERAMQKALRAVSIAPYDADQRERAARVALLNNNTQQAIHQLKALIALEPDRDIHQKRLDALKNRINIAD